MEVVVNRKRDPSPTIHVPISLPPSPPFPARPYSARRKNPEGSNTPEASPFCPRCGRFTPNPACGICRPTPSSASPPSSAPPPDPLTSRLDRLTRMATEVRAMHQSILCEGPALAGAAVMSEVMAVREELDGLQRRQERGMRMLQGVQSMQRAAAAAAAAEGPGTRRPPASYVAPALPWDRLTRDASDAGDDSASTSDTMSDSDGLRPHNPRNRQGQHLPGGLSNRRAAPRRPDGVGVQGGGAAAAALGAAESDSERRRAARAYVDYVDASDPRMFNSLFGDPAAAQRRTDDLLRRCTTTVLQPETETCPICLDELAKGARTTMLLRCMHRFHRGCLAQWFGKKGANPVCPICRSAVG